MKTLHYMELIHFVMMAVSISQVKRDGIFENYVTEVDGAWSLIINYCEIPHKLK